MRTATVSNPEVTTSGIIGVRGNELYLYSQPRPVRILQHSEGWTPERLREQVGAGWKRSFVPLERTRDVYPWQAQ